MIENGKTPHEPKEQIVNRICFPDDENNTHTDYIFRLMKGEENWLWINNEHVLLYYVDCKEGSKSKMFVESEVTTCSSIADEAFFWTQTTFSKYQKYLGMNLTGENLSCFKNAVGFQNEAVNSMKNSNSLEYYYNIQRASEEYNKLMV